MKKVKSTENPDVQKQAFLDATAVALFARGWPSKTIYSQAEQLWALRQTYIAQRAEQIAAKNTELKPANATDSREVGK